MKENKEVTLSIRNAKEEDLPLVLTFIQELADYEKLSHQVIADIETLDYWLFQKKTAEALILECAGQAIGFALFFHNFSTFLGKAGIYLEDLYIRPQYRNHGYGKALMLHLASLTLDRQCGRLEWSCLDWNEPSIGFYERLGAVAQSDWTTYRLNEEALRALVSV